MRKTNLLTRLMALTMLAGLFLVSACGDDDGGEPEVTQNAWEIVNTRSDLTLLAAELQAAGLDVFLATANDVTLFAPTNTAMQTLLSTLGIDDFSLVRDDIATAVLTYHAASQTLLSDAIVPNTLIPTVQGENISVVAGPALSSGATSDSEFVSTDILATNGVIHTIDVVLVPPSIGSLIVATLGTVAQPIYLSADYTTLVEAITKADAGKEPADQIFTFLTTATDVTVFGPPNTVFTLAQITVDDFTAEEWDGIIRSHAVAATLAPLENAANVATVSGLPITTFAPNGDLGKVQGPNNENPIDILFEGVPAGNGVIYPIGGIIM